MGGYTNNGDGIYRIAGNFGEHSIWRNGFKLLLAKFKFGDLNV